MWVAVEIESDLLPLNHLFKTCAEITGCVGGSPHSPPSRITLSVDKHAIILYRELNNGEVKRFARRRICKRRLKRMFFNRILSNHMVYDDCTQSDDNFTVI